MCFVIANAVKQSVGLMQGSLKTEGLKMPYIIVIESKAKQSE